MPDTAVQLFDRAPIPNGVKRDSAGNLVVPPAVVAKTGVYDYAGFELGKPEIRRVRVLRPEAEVFHRDTMRSIAGVPVTIKHPRQLVDVSNWKEHAMGETASDDIVRDGEAVRVPFIVRDGGAIKQIEDGMHELSPGYTAVIDWTAGQDEQYGEYDAIARSIRYNHLAIVDAARGGSDCRIGDEGVKKVPAETKLILVDGFSVEATEASERAIMQLVDQRKEARDEAADLRTKLADAEKAKGEAEGKNAVLTEQLKDAQNPEALSKAAASRSALCDKAKQLAPKLDTAALSDAEIRKAVVVEHLKDAAKDFSDDQIAGAFATLSATIKVTDSRTPSGDQIIGAMRSRVATTPIADEGDVATLLDAREKAREKMLNRFETASQPGSKSDKE